MSSPRIAYLLRHAEKPADPNDSGLSSQGFRRALALRGLFTQGGRFLVPQFLIAAKRSKHSNRCVQTLDPLSWSLGLDIDHGFDSDEYKALAKRLLSGKKYAGATILVCWHHENLPALAKALGVKSKDLPWKEWPDDMYDRIWVLDFGQPGVVSVTSEAQGVVV